MHYHQINVTPAIPSGRAEVYASPALQESIELMRQLVELNKDQHQCLKTMLANQDQSARWKGYLSRQSQVLPELGDSCKRALPHLEKALGHMVQDLTDRINEESECIEEEFFLQEFLDRYGTRLNQIGTLINLVGPMADACPPREVKDQPQPPPT